MSKFLTLKKGLAISSIAALAVTGISAIPAAAGVVDPTRVSLAPTTGVEYNVTTGSTFNLSSNLNTGKLPQVGSLKFLIESSSTAEEDALTTRNRNQVPFAASAVRIESTGLTTATYTMTVADGYKFEVGDYVEITQAIPAKTVTIDLPDDTVLTCYADAGTDFWAYDGDILGDGTTTYTYPALSAGVDVQITQATATTISFGVTGLTTLDPAEPDLDCESNTPGDQAFDGNQRPGLPTDMIITTNLTGLQTNGSSAAVVSDEIAAPGVTDGVVVDSKVNGAAAVTASLSLAVTGTTTRDYVVTAWADADGDDVIDTGEFTSTPQTVTFINPEAVALATDGFVFTSPSAAGSTLSAKITTSPVLNQLQSLHVPRALFTKQVYGSSVLGGIDDYWGGSVRATAAPTAGFEAVTSTSGNVGTNTPGFYTARPYLADRNSVNGVAAGAATDVVGASNTYNSQTTYALAAAVTASIAADRIQTIEASVAGSNNTSPVKTTGSSTSYVRVGTASVSVSAQAFANYADEVSSGAGKTIDVSIGDTTNFKLNGGTSAVSLKTDASGKVSVQVTKNATTGTENTTVVFTGTDVDGTVRTTTVTLDWEDAYYELFNMNDSSRYIDNELSITSTGSAAFAFALHDQWKVPAPAASYRIKYNLFQDGTTTVILNQTLALSGNTANLTVASNGTVGSDAIYLNVWFQKLTGSTWADDGGYTDINIDVVSATQSFKPEVTYYDGDDIENTTKVSGYDRRTSQLASPSYEGDYADVEGVVREATTGLIRPWAKVTISGPADFMFREVTNTDSVDRLGSLTAYADDLGFFDFEVYSNRSVVDAVVTISVEGGASVTQKVTFDAPNEDWATSFAVVAPKSVKAGRTVTATVSVVDEWGNAVSSEGIQEGEQDTQLSAFSNRGLLVIGDPIGDDVGLSVYQVKVMLQPLDRGPVVINLDWYEESGERVTDSFAVWSGPAVNATAGAKKGRVIVEAYRSVGQTVNVFVGSTKVASFVPDAANDKFVVKGIKSGNRKVSVKVTPGYDFAGVIAVK